MSTIWELLNKTAHKYTDNVAIKFNEYKITFSDLNKIICKLANGLIKMGVNKGDRVMLMMPNTPHFIFSYYAVLKIGAILIPVNFLQSNDDIQRMIKETEPNTIIIWNNFLKRLKNYHDDFKNIIVLGEKIPADSISLTKRIADSPDDDLYIDVVAADSALISYTNGIADSPKGVELSHENLTTVVTSNGKLFPTNSSDVYGGLLPLFLLYSQNMVMNSALINGAQLVLYQKIDLTVLSQALYSDYVTVLAGSPAIFQQVSNQSSIEENKQHHLKFVISFGDLCTDEVKQSVERQLSINILEGYGVTEATGLISFNRPKIKFKHGAVGLPIDNLELKIIDQNGIQLKNGEVGEIIVSGKNVMKGYWNQQQRTDDVLKDGWLYTGDLGIIDDEGYLTFINRKEDVVLKGGFHIDPKEIECILSEHPKVKEAAVIGIPDPIHKQEVKACIVLKENEHATKEEIINFCKEHVPVYKCPQLVEFYNSLPKSSMGKILKRKLRESQ